MEVSLVDELLALGVPGKSVELIQQIVDSSEEIVVASNDETVIIRGKSGKKIEIPGRKIGNHTIYCDKNVVVVAWLEHFTYKYLIVGGWNVCRSNSDNN